MINMDTYVKARKLGLKEYHARMQRNENPFLAALEEQVEELNALARVELGLQQIPLRKIVGTASKGRTNAFADNFMPLMEDDTEFAVKYQALIEAHQKEGIRDPVKVYEYMNRFYVEEGNKRASVLKFFGAVQGAGAQTVK